LGSNVAVAPERAWFIEAVEAAGAKLPPGLGVGVGWGVGFCEDDEPPPHPASIRIMPKTTPHQPSPRAIGLLVTMLVAVFLALVSPSVNSNLIPT
jgi:hypothetical protein